MQLDDYVRPAFLGPAVCLLLCLSNCLATQPPQERLEPPAAAEVGRALAAVQAVFGTSADRAKLPRDRAAIAREVYASRTSASTDSEDYAILLYAIDLAARGDDPTLVVAIAADVANKYRVDLPALLAPRLTTVTVPVDPAGWPALASRLEDIVENAITTDSVTSVEELLNAFASLARKAKDARTAAAIVDLRKKLDRSTRDAEKLAALITLKNTGKAGPEDLTLLGELLCYQRGQWAEGLPNLAAGANLNAAKAAKLELVAGAIEERIAAASAWDAVAAGCPLPASTAIRRHAQSILEPVLVTATGLAKVQLQKAIEAIEDKIAAAELSAPHARKWTVVFKSADPTIWNTATNRGAADFAMPATQVPDSMRFLRLAASGKVVIIPLRKPQLTAEQDCGNVVWVGKSAALGNARMLGIAFNEVIDCAGRKDGIAIRNPSANKAQMGFGFGGQIGRDARQGFSWNAVEIPPTAFEIAVSAGPLDAKEKRLLLGSGS
jgi:hypothetical protein